MNLSKTRIVMFIVLLLTAVLIWLSGLHEHLTFEHLQENREMVFSFVDQHYSLSLFIFLSLYILTAFFIPGTLILTVSSGFFFGFITGASYSLLGASLGAVLAFTASRYMIGEWIQRKYPSQLKAFNSEIRRHGYHYLLIFRIVPMLPFFMVNYLAGITRISIWTFFWTTAAGMLPGSLVCAYAGRQLGVITSSENIFSTEVIVSFILLAMLILLPPVVYHVKRFFKS